ncbi:hypothetical protein [Niabella hibiscisoli]|uniref:hypothetical protein n=1 Tax=Niabella hibiscisoli TaxID=1825928 RepID=UPI001F101E25|nr:hypothetical protein [Niabella hibiscisoli]MCH5715121.1 hypothetical protein [Niabella hibiscisoli]
MPEENHFFAVGLTAILGKIVIIISLFIVQKNRKLLFHISGLCLLWLSVIYFGYDAANDSYVHIAWVTVVPFFICTILTFTGKYLKKAYHWLGENL